MRVSQRWEELDLQSHEYGKNSLCVCGLQSEDSACSLSAVHGTSFGAEASIAFKLMVT